MQNQFMFVVGTVIFIIYVYFYFKIVLGKSKKRNKEF
jgi:hypothetical protein